ncbi:hypothetical protein Tco_0767060 [Tanacetum coccineum]
MVTPEIKRVDRYIRGLALRTKGMVTSSKPTFIQSVVSMANRLTHDAVRDGVFKKESTGNKRRVGDQSRNRGGRNKDKRQRTGRNFALIAPDQGKMQRQWAISPSIARAELQITDRSRPTLSVGARIIFEIAA